MTYRMAILGFRHDHIRMLYQHAVSLPDVEIVAACEPDASTRQQLERDGEITITHSDPFQMLDTVDCDVVAVGDLYADRGRWLLQALQRDKHVISDKPVCIGMEELDAIEREARRRDLCVGCLFDLRDLGAFIGLRNLIRENRLGTVHSVQFNGQHPLMRQTRPAWYFEPGCHGGTLNDIAVHACDLIPWLTGQSIQRVDWARAWNARFEQAPHFQDAAHLVWTLENGAAVMGDVSYLSPDRTSYTLPLYWRVTCWGDTGVAEAGVNQDHILLASEDRENPESLPLPAPRPMGYLLDFLDDIHGRSTPGQLTTTGVLTAARFALQTQHVADTLNT